MKIIELDEVDSTNEYLKRVSCGEDTVVTAVRQSAGRGTKGKSFESAEGGLYLSIMRFYDNFPAENAFHIMIDSCVAVCHTLEYFGVKPVIKWPNDVLANGRKICGTLIENTFSNGHITRSIVGCGINVNNSLSSSLKDIAVSMREILNKPLEVAKVKQVLIENLQNRYTVEDYKRYINWFNSPATLKTQDLERVVTPLDVTADGLLLVDWDGDMLEISSAEVSLKL